MKGTAPRRADPAADAAEAAALAADPKQRAENLMIVDLLRNDLARVAETGQRRGARPVRGRDLSDGPPDGQPDHRAAARRARRGRRAARRSSRAGRSPARPRSRRSRRLRGSSPSRAAPTPGRWAGSSRGGDAAFNVLIRTLEWRHGERPSRGSGSDRGLSSTACRAMNGPSACSRGISWSVQRQNFDLIETMRFDPHDGIVELDRHLDRLSASADDARFPLRPPRRAQRAAGRDLRPQGAGDGAAAAVADGHDGDPGQAVTSEPQREPVRVAVRPLPVDAERLPAAPQDHRPPLLRPTRGRTSGAYETIFVDPEGQLTEGSRTSIFVERDGKLLTPPLEPRADPGHPARQADRRRARPSEADLTPDDLADGFFVGNIVRGLIPARLRLGRDREAQQAVGDRDQRRRAGADLPA